MSVRGGTEDGSEEWGYVPLRPGASMFYWFYRTTHPDGYRNRPIVLWLQGGPGVPGSGVGNFLEFGPLNEKLEPRNTSWIRTANILFVDNPVGSGFSTNKRRADIPDTIEKISDDLITLLQIFMNEHHYFRNNSLHVFGQSYGGKMAPALAYYLHKAIKEGKIICNLRGVGIGNGFVSPVDFILSISPMLYQMGAIDDEQYDKFNKLAVEGHQAALKKNWKVMRSRFDSLLESIEASPEINVYNVLDLITREKVHNIYDVDISKLMNGQIKEKLKIIPDEHEWKGYSEEIHLIQEESLDLFIPIWHLVDDLLKNTDLDIVVYSGQMDVICSTAGALAWIQRLSWPGLQKYNEADRKTLLNPTTKIPEMFVKSSGHLKMYWVLNAGHAVPHDVPDVALRMLNRILDGVD